MSLAQLARSALLPNPAYPAPPTCPSTALRARIGAALGAQHATLAWLEATALANRWRLPSALLATTPLHLVFLILAHANLVPLAITALAQPVLLLRKWYALLAATAHKVQVCPLLAQRANLSIQLGQLLRQVAARVLLDPTAPAPLALSYQPQPPLALILGRLELPSPALVQMSALALLVAAFAQLVLICAPLEQLLLFQWQCVLLAPTAA